MGKILHNELEFWGSSSIPSVILRSSRLNGSVDMQHLSKHTVSEVLFVFVR